MNIKKIAKIEYTTKEEEKKKFERATVYYEDGTNEKIDGHEKVALMLTIFADQNNIKVLNDLEHDSRIIDKTVTIDSKKITKIEYTTKIEDGSTIYDSATVYYEDGTNEEVKGDLEVAKIIVKFSNQEDLSISEMKSNKKLVEITKEEEETIETSDTVTDEDKKGKRGKRGLALFSALAFGAAALGFTAIYFLNKDKSKQFANNETKTKQEDVITPGPTVTPRKESKNVTIVKETDVYEPVSEEYNETFQNNLNGTVKSQDRLTILLVKAINGESLTNSELTYLMDNINRICMSNVAEIGNLLVGGRMQGDKYTLSFTDAYDNGTFDYYIMNEFCTKRNKIVTDAYKQDANLTRGQVKRFVDSFIDFAINGKYIRYHGEEYGYYDLKPITRYILVDMAQMILTAYPEYTATINNTEYGFMDVINQMESCFDTDATELEYSVKIR